MRLRIVMPYSRPENVPALYNHLAGQGVIWHPIIADVAWPEGYEADWIETYAVGVPAGADPFAYKLNAFARSGRIVDGDRYCLLCDDDMYEPGFLDAVRGLKDKVIVTSMKMGHHVPANGRPHGTATLVASQENMRADHIGMQQVLVLGQVFKRLEFPLDRADVCDGLAAEWIKANYPDDIRFVPGLFVLFNKLQPGRWDS